MTEQQRLAEQIRLGYSKHNLNYSNSWYFDETEYAACPIFAAYSASYPSPYLALEVLNEPVNGSYAITMADKLGISRDLCLAVSLKHDKDSKASVEGTIELLANNQFVY